MQSNVYIYTLYEVARKLLHSFYLDPALGRSLKRASRAEEIPQSQIVREAIRVWLEERGHLEPKAKGGKRTR